MKFNSIDRAHRYLKESHVIYKGEDGPRLCKVVSYSRGRLVMYDILDRHEECFHVPFKDLDEKLEYDFKPSLFNIKTATGGKVACYMKRNPARQWRAGINQQNTEIRVVLPKGHDIIEECPDIVADLHIKGFFKHLARHVIESSYMKDLGEALECSAKSGGSFVAMSPKFAIERDGNLIMDGKIPIGKLNRDGTKVKIKKGLEFVKEKLFLETGLEGV